MILILLTDVIYNILTISSCRDYNKHIEHFFHTIQDDIVFDIVNVSVSSFHNIVILKHVVNGSCLKSNYIQSIFSL